MIAVPLLWVRFGHWFYLSLDEGIVLDGARRVATGEVPYRDFFNITGPGSFWLYGLVFRIFGTSFPVARALLCVELAAMCALVCALVARFGRKSLAIASGLLFLTIPLTTLFPVYVTHRWDSNLFALAALVCALGGWVGTVGVLAALAAWTTPPLLWMLPVLFAIARSERRRYLGGVAAVSIPCCAVLVSQGALNGMVSSLLWDAANYGVANRLPYGALAGTVWRNWIPVLLPLAGGALFSVAWVLRRDRLLAGVAAASVAALVACFPRAGAAQLLFASAFFFALFSCSLAVILPRRSQGWCAGVVLLAAVALGGTGRPATALKRIETPAGGLAVSRLHFVTLNELLVTIRPHDRIFVYPYLPALYFVLGADNPTRYSWLQPGMMGQAEERGAIADLILKPPRWVVWHELTPAYILKNWPSGDRSRLRFPEMEAFLLANYHEVNPDGVVPVGYRLLEKNL